MELQDWVQQLAERDWRRVAEAERRLVASGDAGIAAILEGMQSSDSRIRRACAGFMDHHGTDQSIPGLLEALDDSVPRVRREAVHSLSCNRCKESPLCLDMIPTLISVLEKESNAKVRCEAIYGLNQQKPDARAIPILKRILSEETNGRVKKAAHLALKHHDPEYKRQVDEAARTRSLLRFAEPDT